MATPPQKPVPPPEALASVPARVRVKKGETVTLADGARFTFTAHSHKRTRTGGPPSPLIVYGSFAPPGAARATEFQRNLHPEESRRFELDGYAFEAAAEQYDAWIELRYFGKTRTETP